MSSDEEERSLNKQIFKNPVEVQKARLDRLMKNPEKTVFIPERKEMKPPRAFQPHEFVRNVMGASAGAGSGEFDIYRGCRRRQIIREAYLNRQAKEQEANAQWAAKVENSKQRFESQSAKKRQKRLKRKQNQKKQKPSGNQNGKKSEESGSSSSDSDEDNEAETAEEKKETESEVPTTEETTAPPPVESDPVTQEKGNSRRHIRNRKDSSSDEEKNESAN